MPPDALSTNVTWAEAKNSVHLVFIVNSYLTNAARVWIDKRSANFLFQIDTVEGKIFKRLILGYADLLERYFLDRDLKLLQDVTRKWIYHRLLPAPSTLSQICQYTIVQKLTTGQLVFCGASVLLRAMK